jgi:integrase
MCWKTLLMSGVREEELTHLHKRDVRVNDDGSWIIRVEGKPELSDWTPKTHEERNINIPAYLGRELVEFSRHYMPNSPMLFPTVPRHGSMGGKANGRLLDALKRDARRAGLKPEDFWLHGFVPLHLCNSRHTSRNGHCGCTGAVGSCTGKQHNLEVRTGGSKR